MWRDTSSVCSQDAGKHANTGSYYQLCGRAGSLFWPNGLLWTHAHTFTQILIIMAHKDEHTRDIETAAVHAGILALSLMANTEG